VPGETAIVVGMVRPPVILMRMGSCAGAAELSMAAMQMSREGFADSERNSARTVGDGSRQIHRWESGFAASA